MNVFFSLSYIMVFFGCMQAHLTVDLSRLTDCIRSRADCWNYHLE